jgi:hypothetical protein
VLTYVSLFETIPANFFSILSSKNKGLYVKALMRLNTQIKEYNSLVFSTYSSLNEAYKNQQSHMYEAIMAAKSNTEQLVYELRTLYHSIRSYMRKIQGQQDVNLLLKDHK